MDFFSQLANYSFPMAVAAFLLVRIEGKLDELNKSLTELISVIAGKDLS
ncbi:conserved hypothetical protein [Carboxydothermus islandicus]|uniref:YvrJ family protein n=1 Tax=Carboxydothermus islandicus TaxID=661089 RepID=A0A1L8D279_9THEO|nr:YvrJ family protein [Carboxydothermus islandicus]GAV25282.1 conserved hypothetical protein [Carboxydothermus islandicus]